MSISSLAKKKEKKKKTNNHQDTYSLSKYMYICVCVCLTKKGENTKWFRFFHIFLHKAYTQTQFSFYSLHSWLDLNINWNSYYLFTSNDLRDARYSFSTIDSIIAIRCVFIFILCFVNYIYYHRRRTIEYKECTVIPLLLSYSIVELFK